jgi:engulfment/cell motility protein 1
LVNILRGAVSILAAVVAKPSSDGTESPDGLQGGQQDRTLGFRALKPILIHHPTFLEMLVTRLSSADHALCANALQLINALMRDAITSSNLHATSTISGSSGEEWPLFIKRLQDLGVIKAVYNLMQSSGIQDLAHPLYDFQALTKILLRKWRAIPVNIETKDHRRGLKAVHLSSLSESERAARISQQSANGANKLKPPLEINRWRNLGFDTEHPTSEFAVFGVGYLGLMDLMDFARQSPDGFHKLLLEKSFLPQKSRCPIAKASLAVTAILYDHFEVESNVTNGSKIDDNDELFDQQRYTALESRSNLDGVFRPLLLQWSRLHTASLLAFVRLWDETGAQADEDFLKIEELVRILVEHVVGLAGRTDDVLGVERKMQEYELKELRVLQMELLELTHEDHWGVHMK